MTEETNSLRPPVKFPDARTQAVIIFDIKRRIKAHPNTFWDATLVARRLKRPVRIIREVLRLHGEAIPGLYTPTSFDWQGDDDDR